ncbi:MAG: nucleoside triphosphate pyrophosphohydrolase [Candidatus Woesearchaeota archaeon]
MSKEIKYDKLVRDKVPQIIENAGKEYTIHIADDSEYIKKLLAKVEEELAEFKENPSVEEMADIFEVLDGLISYYHLDYDEIKAVKREKKEKRGGFEDRLILEKVKE